MQALNYNCCTPQMKLWFLHAILLQIDFTESIYSHNENANTLRVNSITPSDKYRVWKLTTFGSNNGLSPCRRQTIIWTNASVLLIGPMEINFIWNLIEIDTFSFKKTHLKMSSKWPQISLGLQVLISWLWDIFIGGVCDVRISLMAPHSFRNGSYTGILFSIRWW